MEVKRQVENFYFKDWEDTFFEVQLLLDSNTNLI